MIRWPVLGLLLILAANAQASDSTTRLRLPEGAVPAPGVQAPVVQTPAPAAPTPTAPVRPATNLQLRIPPAQGAPIAPEPPGSPPRSVTLPDGTISITPALLAQEMLKNESAAINKYRGKPVQFQGVLNYHAVNQIGAFLSLTVNVPMVGYKYFYCLSFDRDSYAAARSLKTGDTAVMAGIFITADLQDMTLAKYMHITGRVALKTYDTLNFAECVILTGHPNATRARALMAGWANARQLWK